MSPIAASNRRPPALSLPMLPPDLADRIAALPRLTGIVAEFLDLSRRDYVTARQFETLIARDRELSRWLLRQANSGFFRTVRPITTLGDSLVIIGLERMKRMVYAAVARDLYDRRLRCYAYAGQGFWLHALGVGVAARGLAAGPLPSVSAVAAGEASTKSPRDLDSDAAFVAGLVHDAGKRLLDEVLPRRGGRRTVSLAEERAACGLDHALLSAHIARSWHLPDPVVASIAGHHAVDVRQLRDGAAVVALADAIAHTWRIGTRTYPKTADAIAMRPWRPLLTALGFDERAWQRWLGGLRPVMEGLAEMLRLCVAMPLVPETPAPQCRPKARSQR